MTSFENVRATMSSNKFDTLIVVENGLILKKGIMGEQEIPFSELDKIYVKSYKLNPIIKLLFILFPFFLVFLSAQYFSFDLVILAALFTVFPVFIAVHNCKWYSLIVCKTDGKSFRKKVPKYLKTENISIMEKVHNEFLSYKCSLLASA